MGKRIKERVYTVNHGTGFADGDSATCLDGEEYRSILGVIGHGLSFAEDIALAFAGQDVKVYDAVFGDFHDGVVGGQHRRRKGEEKERQRRWS